MWKNGFIKKMSLDSTFTKMLISFIFIVIFTVLAFSAALYYQFSKATVSDTAQNYQEKLEQNMRQMEYIRDQIFALGNQLLNNSDMIKAMYWADLNIMDENRIVQELGNVKNSYSMLHSIFLYNGLKEELISNLGSFDDTPLTSEIFDFIVKYNMKGNPNFRPIILKYDKNGKHYDESIISIVFTDYKGSVENDDGSYREVLMGAVIINLKAEYIKNLFASPGTGKGFNTIIINNNGNVICGSGPIAFGSNAGAVDYIAPLLSSDKKSGYFIEGKKDKTLVIYSKAENMPFLFVSIPGYNQVLEKIYSLRDTILIIFAGIFALGLIISIMAAYNIYLPFNRLLGKISRQLRPDDTDEKTKIGTNEINYLSDIFTGIISRTNELETAMNEYKPFVRKMLLKGLLAGDSTVLNDTANNMQELNLNMKEYICVLLTSIDNYVRPNSLSSRFAQIDLMSEVEKAVISMLSTNFGIESVVFEDGYLALILTNSVPDAFDVKINTSLEEARKMILNKYKISVTSVIGFMVDRIEDINLSYANCRDLLKYRFILGYGSVIDNHAVDAGRKSKYIPMDRYTEKLIHAIKSCSIDQTNRELDIIFQQMPDLQYDYIRLTINQLALDIIKSVEPLMNSDSYEINYNNIYSNLNNIGSLNEVREWFALYCEGIIRKIENKKDNRMKEMMDTVLDYLKKNYGNSDISAEMLANMVNITPGYFGKQFASYMNKSLNEYLIELRMKKAKELLEQDSVTVSEITGKVGFTSHSYFTAIFKKHFGLTPAQYRVDYKKTTSF